MLESGGGQDVIHNNDGDPDSQDTLQFGTAIGARDLWFRRNGNDLTVSLLGRNDRVTFDDWYANDADKIDRFTLSDGQRLAAADVDQLVSAMAGFAPSTGAGSRGITAASIPQNVQLAINTAWSAPA